jgi:hypothetical protein
MTVAPCAADVVQQTFSFGAVVRLSAGQSMQKGAVMTALKWPTRMTTLGLGAIVTLSTFASCKTAELEPAAGANEVAENVIERRQNGVELRLMLDRWPGQPNVLRYAAPVHVMIDNESGKPIDLSLDDFRIYEADADISIAMNPVALGRHMENAENLTDTQPEPNLYINPLRTGGTGPGGLASPGTSYPIVQKQLSPRDESQRQHWPDDLAELALRMGVVETGEAVSGYIFFELVPRDSNDLTLTITLDSDDDDSTVASFNIPLKS